MNNPAVDIDLGFILTIHSSAPKKADKYSMITMIPPSPRHSSLANQGPGPTKSLTQLSALKPKAGSSDQIKKPREWLVSPLPNG